MILSYMYCYRLQKRWPIPVKMRWKPCCAYVCGSVSFSFRKVLNLKIFGRFQWNCFSLRKMLLLNVEWIDGNVKNVACVKANSVSYVDTYYSFNENNTGWRCNDMYQKKRKKATYTSVSTHDEGRISWLFPFSLSHSQNIPELSRDFTG